MSKPTHESSSPIDRLLQDRAQFVSWLTRLNSSTDSPAVPEAVRGRVRADYERRLTAVVEELRGHTSAIDSQVEGLSARRDELAKREREQEEQLSEAEIRHLVGEYDEGRWDGIRTELMKVMLAVRDELGHTTREIDRLAEVLSTIRAPLIPPTPPVVIEPPAPPPPAPVVITAPQPAVLPELILPEPLLIVPEPVAPPPAPAPVRPVATAPVAPTAPVGGTEIPFRAPAPRPQPQPQPKPAPKKEEAASRTLWFPSGKPNDGTGEKLDELAFLKSVTGSEAPAAPGSAPPQKPRASGGFIRQAEPITPPPAPEPVIQKASPPATPAAHPPVPAAPPPAAESKDRPSGAQKTLKCGECGTLNRPTEWYCERCGAELAAL
ncbi:MAG: zinc finger Ran-binding domain-containing protein [Gemmatimonadales bacterium]